LATRRRRRWRERAGQTAGEAAEDAAWPCPPQSRVISTCHVGGRELNSSLHLSQSVLHGALSEPRIADGLHLCIIAYLDGSTLCLNAASEISVENANRGSRPNFWIWHQATGGLFISSHYQCNFVSGNVRLAQGIAASSFFPPWHHAELCFPDQGLCATQLAYSSSIILTRTVSRYVIEFFFFWYARLAATRLHCNLTTRQQRITSVPIYGQ
jgi:hypothetical protein